MEKHLLGLQTTVLAGKAEGMETYYRTLLRYQETCTCCTMQDVKVHALLEMPLPRTMAACVQSRYNRGASSRIQSSQTVSRQGTFSHSTSRRPCKAAASALSFVGASSLSGGGWYLHLTPHHPTAIYRDACEGFLICRVSRPTSVHYVTFRKAISSWLQAPSTDHALLCHVCKQARYAPRQQARWV